MKIPRYWARAEGSAAGPDGRRFRVALWGWSNDSEAEARASAERRKAEVEARVVRGDALRVYSYGERVLREERIRIIGDEADPTAVVTRNRYGSIVLNTARVPFIDVDSPAVDPPKPRFRLFGGKDKGDPVLEGIRDACRQRALQSFRVYRTKAGYRVLVTDMTIDASAETTRALLESFGADPAFVTLCRLQQSFRARLTPKPWRCDCPPPPGSFPRETAEAQARFDEWLRHYDGNSAGFATCRYLETIGPGRQSDEARAVVIEHDRMSKAESDLPLA